MHPCSGILIITDLNEGDSTTFVPYRQMHRKSIKEKRAADQCNYVIAHHLTNEVQVIGI